MSKVDYANGRYSYQPSAPVSGTGNADRLTALQSQFLYAQNQERRDGGMANANSDGTTSLQGLEHRRSSTDIQNEITRLKDQAGQAPTGLGQAQQNWNSALDMTQGRGDATMNDPRVGAALDLLQQHTKEGPYTGEVVNQQANRMADRTSAMAGNQAQSLRERAANSGGNVNDPSYQAAMNQANTGRMQQNNADRGDLETQATLNNYREQGNAAGQLGNMRMGQLGMANNQYNQASQLYANQQISGGHTNALGSGDQGKPQKLGYQTPQYNPQDWSAIVDAINGNGGNGGYGGEEQPSPAPLPVKPSGTGGGNAPYTPNPYNTQQPQYTPPGNPTVNKPGWSGDNYKTGTNSAQEAWDSLQNSISKDSKKSPQAAPYTYTPRGNK